jgi:hypothetical protein
MYALCFAVCGVVVLICAMGTKPKIEDFTAATSAVIHWESAGDRKAFAEMQKCLGKVPELAVKYRPFIAQKLFLEKELEGALSMASIALQQIQHDVPFHAAYAETSLLIERREFQQALEHAVALKEQMRRECQFSSKTGDVAIGSVLFAHNLLRIACLQQELHNPPGEKVAWEELETFLKDNEAVSNLILSNFRDKELDLHHYIAERKKTLA